MGELKEGWSRAGRSWVTSVVGQCPSYVLLETHRGQDADRTREEARVLLGKSHEKASLSPSRFSP